MIRTISMRELEGMIEKGGSFTLADVREEDEYRRGHLRGAVNLPMERLGEADELLTPGQPVIVYCAHGGNSLLAARELAAKGYDVINAYGGLAYYRGRNYIRGAKR